MNFKDAEILAPVGNFDMLYAAVRSGANAVYLGAKDFSARRNAQNFALDELAEAINYCHIRGVKAYLTLNILIKDAEMSSAFSLALKAYNLGIDGIIIQDLGLARILHEKIPELPLHASTQMSVHSPAALELLKELGFTQVVVAREMSKQELVPFCQRAKELGITVEVFVHGALCMCMSGQCLMSAFLGSRSGNRGLCAGPCRLPFKVTGGTGYDLSLKDLSLLEYLTELYEMGVRSFKIEGRMKRPEYVAAAVASCKEALTSGKVNETLEETLKNVFSRSGFTDGYYTNNLGRDMFGIRTKEDVTAADKAFPLLHNLYRNELQSVPISVRAKINKDEPISLTLSDNCGHSVTAQGAIPSLAQSKPLTYESVLNSICKFGGTPYIDEGGAVDLEDGLFVSASELNALRREACENLSLARCEITREPSFAEYRSENPKPPQKKNQRLFLRVEEAEQIPQNLNSVDGIIFPIEKDFNKSVDGGIDLIVDIPRGIASEEGLKQRLAIFKSKGFKYALCGNLSAVKIAKDQGFSVMADAGLNIANSESLKTAENFEISAAVISVEETLDSVSELNSTIPKGIIAYGNIPLMLFKNCPLKNGISCSECNKKGYITDRLGEKFRIRCRNGYSELLNSRPIWLADKKNDLKSLDFLILYLCDETKEEVENIISAYKNGGTCSSNYTRGLYYRGTI